MDIIFYIAIFIIGTVFGSFYTLAVYRIPKRQDITHTHSYCPKCEHKLGFLDLIPVWSYIFLGGKCRYCKEKIRPRYFILELMSGIIFLIVAIFMNFNIENLTIIKIFDYAFFALYFTFVVLMAGIDKEYRTINKPVLMYGVIISIMYIVYLYIIEKTSIYRYAIYLALFIILLLIDTINLKKYAKNSYIYSVLMVIVIMAIFTGEYVTINTILATLIFISAYLINKRLKNSKNRKTTEQFYPQLRLGLYLSIFNVISTIVVLSVCRFM